MDHLTDLENLACLRHDATVEEGPSTPDKMVSGLSICCDQDKDEMWKVPVQEKGPHLPEELAMSLFPPSSHSLPVRAVCQVTLVSG